MTPVKSSESVQGFNSVELLGYYGGDETHALSAWTSTSRDLTDEKRNRMGKLLHDLASAGHATPFEKSSLHFLITSDVASHIHLIKHRVGVSVNAESARYKELKDDKFYIPVDWDEEERSSYVGFMEDALKCYHQTLERLVAKGMSRKRAKESARFYLPYGNQITADVMFNFKSFTHFMGLRYSEHAQLEVRELALKMLQQVLLTGKFNMSLSAFKYIDVNGVIVPPGKLLFSNFTCNTNIFFVI